MIIFLIIGSVAGWLAGLLLKRRGFGLLGTSTSGLVGSFITATVGAIVVLLLVRLIKKA